MRKLYLIIAWLTLSDVAASQSLVAWYPFNGNSKVENALSVDLMNFKATVLPNKNVSLSWQTASEYNNLGFEVERSLNALQFDKIGFVKGTGNSNVLNDYSFTDNSAYGNRVYYRLKQIDQDNQVKTSDMVTIWLGNPGIINVYPNPAKQTMIVENVEKYDRIEIFNMRGLLLKLITGNQQNTVTIDVNKFINGNYMVRLSNKENIESVIFVVSR